MDLQKLAANNNEEYLFYKQSAGPHILEVSQQYPEDVYVDVPGEKQKIPFILKVYIGGLSVVGLYIVYRMLQKSSRN
jgi:hypothetical protein